MISAIAGCGGDSPKSPDAPPTNNPPPRIIPGGGIGDGAIDSVANLYVIDDVTRQPISGATVRVGTLDGATDATGLFVATGVTGPQTVLVTAPSYQSAMWLGANGANMTIDLTPTTAAALTKADLSGQITGFGGITVAAGHIPTAVITYSQSDDISDAENNLQTTGSANVCYALTAGAGCSFTVTSRTGQVALIAAIYDRDLHGTDDPNDDTQTLIGWAVRRGITVVNGANQAGQDLTMVDVGMLANETVDFGTPPAALPTVAGLIGIDVGADGVIQLPSFLSPTTTTLLAPGLAAFTGATGYRLTGLANNGNNALTAAQSVVVRRGLTGTSLAAGTWLAPPTGITVTRTTAAWTAIEGATVESIVYSAANGDQLLSVTAFDGSTSITLPDLVALPSGAITAKVQGIGAPGLDVANFGLDADRDKLAAVSAQPMTIN